MPRIIQIIDVYAEGTRVRLSDGTVVTLEHNGGRSPSVGDEVLQVEKSGQQTATVSDLFLSELPQASQDLVAAAEIYANLRAKEAREHGQRLERFAYELGVSASTIDFAPGNRALETADHVRSQGREEAAQLLFRAASVEWWKKLRPDVAAFAAKLNELWRWAHRKFNLDSEIAPEHTQAWCAWAFRERAHDAEIANTNTAARASLYPKAIATKEAPLPANSKGFEKANPFPVGHRSHAPWNALPQDTRDILSNRSLQFTSELLEFDEQFQEQFAEKPGFDLLQRYCLGRLDMLADQLLITSISADPASLNPEYIAYLDGLEQAGEEFSQTVLHDLRSDVRGEILSRIGMRLSSRKLHWVQEAIKWRLKGYPPRSPLNAKELLKAEPTPAAGPSLDELVRSVAPVERHVGDEATSPQVTEKVDEPMDEPAPGGRPLEAPTSNDSNQTRTDLSWSPNLKASRWEDVEIVFLSEFTLQIHINSRVGRPLTYTEIGFENKKSKKTVAAWETLKELARCGGTYRVASDGRAWSKIEKRMQELRRAFRQGFGLPGDPIQFKKKTARNQEDFGFCTKFAIRCHRSYDA